MNMVGKIRDKNETMDMDQLFSSGYIIELETGKYLSGYNKKVYEVPRWNGQYVFVANSRRQSVSASIYATLDWKHGFVKFCGYCFRISTS